MSIQDKAEQVELLKEIASSNKELDIEGKFDDLVDYLRDRGYGIVKREFKPTTPEDLQKESEKLFGRTDVRDAEDLERFLKRVCRERDLDPSDAFETLGEAAIRVAAASGQSKDFAQAIEYIKAGHAFIQETKKSDE